MRKICKIDGCNNASESRGWCSKHYMRWHRHGDPNIGGRGTLKERFESKFYVTPSCWVWTGGIGNNGYGQIHSKGRLVTAPRISWELYRSKISKGMHVLHKCDNPSCVNPAHLFLGTHQDNMDDKVLKGRQTKGENVPQSKLTENDIHEIRSSNELQKILAERYGVKQTAISKIKLRERWKHI